MEKLNTYFSRLVLEPDPSFYVIATALHPRLRLPWFKTRWKDFPQWHTKAEKSIYKVFRQYVDLEVEPDVDAPPPQLLRHKTPAGSSYSFDDTMSVDLMLLTGARSHKKQKRVSQLEEYYNDLRDDMQTPNQAQRSQLDEPWQWWLTTGRTRYLVVFKMARDFLSIPATSCDCERAFSKARRTITCDRNALSGVTIEALQLQKNWLQRRVVQSEFADLQDCLATQASAVGDPATVGLDTEDAPAADDPAAS